jgi:proteasome assembly chaperone (PAC2) family protein
VPYPVAVPLYRLHEPLPALEAPRLVVALDGWVDAGTAATSAAKRVAEGGDTLATFRADDVFDYRARRPTLEIVDGRPTTLTWPELTLRHRRISGADVLVLTGAEPDYRWHELCADVVGLARRLGVVEWISLGAIPAAVPHTRAVPILGTASDRSRLAAGIRPGPEGTLTVPAAAVSVLDISVSSVGIPSVGYFAQVPHYTSGPYPAAAIELLRVLGRHLGLELDAGRLEEEARLMRVRLDAASRREDSTREYVERLEAMVDEARSPEGEDLIGEIERFLRDGGRDMGSGGRPN